MIGGVRADSAWKFSAGDPEVVVAVLDNGVRWENEEVVDKVHLNRAELPKPNGDGPSLRDGVDCTNYTATGLGGYDKNGDGAVNVADYACDERISDKGGKGAGDEEADDLLDGSDLIAAFSDGTDADGNGYRDDIAGWDFFDDDNDPFSSSACCERNHGTNRMKSAAAATDNGRDEAGICPDCQVMPVRTSYDIVHDTNLVAFGTVYAADNGADVTLCACGGFPNSNYARRAFRYADTKGLAQMIVSSDINSANHNYPTHYNEAIYVAGTLPDTAPTESCELPSLPFADVPEEIPRDSPECKAFLKALNDAGGPAPNAGAPGQAPTTSFFRNSNLTQYGGKNDISLVGQTGSINTGQAGGAAGLLESYARKELGSGLSGNETRQLLTMTAEDVLPDNTGSIGQPDRANKGWDSHFGYGRVNLAAAMRRIQEHRIPPEVQIDSPDWFAPIPVEQVSAEGLAVRGRVGSPHISGDVEWRLDYACGQDARDEDDFEELVDWTTGEPNGELARIPKSVLEDLADNCDGSVSNDPGRPAGKPAQVPWPVNPYPDPDPERHAFQIRLTAREEGDEGNVGRYRKTLFAYHQDGLRPGWPKAIGPDENGALRVTGSGGDALPRLADLSGDNRLEVVLPTSSGELHVLRADGTPLPSFNDGDPVRSFPYAQGAAHGAGGVGGEPPLTPMRNPAVGDITGDGEPEIVVTAGERVHAWDRHGQAVRGFPVRLDPFRSAPCKPGRPTPCFEQEDRLRTEERHVQLGFFSSPALADFDGDGRLDIVAAALDQHLYAWDGEGQRLPGFPTRLDSGDEDDGAEIVASPAIADLGGDGDPEVIVATNEASEESVDFDLRDPFGFLAGQVGVSVTYAVHGDGKPVDGWPVKSGALAPDLLPLVLPGEDAAAGELDRSRKGDEVVITTGSGGAKLVAGDGETIRSFASQPGPDSNVADKSTEVQGADYPAIGRFSDGQGPSVVKGGFTAAGAVNILASNQNLLFNHVVQAWDPTRDVGGVAPYRPGWPVATDDWQILVQPGFAKVGGSGGARQALVPTGLYQLHAYGADGGEPAGWPKFTGGWMLGTPAVGDMDADGRLDVAMTTREGWAFAWRTTVPECEAGGASTNAEWWTFHHDEHGTSNYGHDARPPSRPEGAVTTAASGGDLRLVFNGSGDDLRCGDPRRYQVAGSDSPIDSGADFQRATRLRATESEGASAAEAGDQVALRVENGARFRFIAVRAVDDAGNASYVEQAARGGDGVGGRPGDDEGGGAAGSGGGGPGAGRDLSAGADEGAAPGAGEERDGGGGSLPFTGLALALLALLGLALLAAGRALRRRSQG